MISFLYIPVLSTARLGCDYTDGKAVIHRQAGTLHKHHPFILYIYFLRGVSDQGDHMTDFLALAYPWTKSLHIIAVITWMAGVFYLPRLFVYHAEQSMPGDSRDQVFTVMEFKLYRYIMNPSLIAVWVFGLLLVVTPGIVDWSAVWPWVKAIGVLGMTWFHMWLGQRRKEFASGTNGLSGRGYRLMNEVPTVLMIAIVVAVVVKF